MVLPERPGPMANQAFGLPERSTAVAVAASRGCVAEGGGRPTGTSSSSSNAGRRENWMIVPLGVGIAVSPLFSDPGRSEGVLRRQVIAVMRLAWRRRADGRLALSPGLRRPLKSAGRRAPGLAVAGPHG